MIGQPPFWLEVLMPDQCAYPEDIPIFLVRSQPGAGKFALTPTLRMVLMQHIARRAAQNIGA